MSAEVTWITAQQECATCGASVEWFVVGDYCWDCGWAFDNKWDVLEMQAEPKQTKEPKGTNMSDECRKNELEELRSRLAKAERRLARCIHVLKRARVPCPKCNKDGSITGAPGCLRCTGDGWNYAKVPR